MSNKKEIIPIISEKKDKKLSKLQKQFNYCTKHIKSLKKKIENIRAYTQECFDRFQNEIVPLEDKVLEARIAFVKTLDASYQDKYFRKVEKLVIQEIIEGETYTLIEQYGVDELIEIHDRYSDETYQDLKDDSKVLGETFAKSFIENMFDIEIDGVGDLESPEDFANLQEEVQKKIEERERQYQETQKNRKKSKSQQAKEKQVKEEPQNLSKTSRAIYTELVKELHPDKEQDEQEKNRKTEIMKKVTEAYNNGDFFELMRLQIEYKQGGDKIENLADDQLKYYNKILLDQMRELQQEKYMLTYPPPPLNQIFFNMDLAKTVLQNQFKIGMLKFEMEAKEITETSSYIKKKTNLRKFLKQYIQ